MSEELNEFKTALASALTDLVTAISEVAQLCEDPQLREKVFALKRCVERTKALCEVSSERGALRGEPAVDFASEPGEVPRIVEL